MAASICPQCHAELPEGTNPCPRCGSAVPTTQPVNFTPAFAGAALFVVVLLICEWLQIVWPVALVGVAYLVFVVVQYGKLAYVAPVPRALKIEAEVPVGELLEKVEVPEPKKEEAVSTEPVCPSCGTPKGDAVRFCGNCGQPFPS